MSLELKNNKIIIKQEVDLSFILKEMEVLEKERSCYSISREVKKSVLEKIEKKLEKAIVSKLNLEQKVEKGDWSEYEKVIDEKIEDKIKKVVEEKVQKEIDTVLSSRWENSKIEKFISSSIKQNFTESIHPKISRIMKKVVSINPVKVDDLINDITKNNLH